MFNIKEKRDAEDLMDVLSEKYKEYENDFWDVNNIKIEIGSENDAAIKLYKHGSYNCYKRIIMNHNKFMRLLHVPFDLIIDMKIKRVKKQLINENRNIKKLIDLKIKYERW